MNSFTWSTVSLTCGDMSLTVSARRGQSDRPDRFIRLATPLLPAGLRAAEGDKRNAPLLMVLVSISWFQKRVRQGDLCPHRSLPWNHKTSRQRRHVARRRPVFADNSIHLVNLRGYSEFTFSKHFNYLWLILKKQHFKSNQDELMEKLKV